MTRAEQRPCRYCTANYGEYADDEMCEMTHQRPADEVAPLATALARIFQDRNPTDQQVGYFMQDADEVIGDFDPIPEKWRVRKLPMSESDEFIQRFRINDVTYVVEDGEGYIPPVRLSDLRAQQREADARV
jgi:hypothetical protein